MHSSPRRCGHNERIPQRLSRMPILSRRTRVRDHQFTYPRTYRSRYQLYGAAVVLGNEPVSSRHYLRAREEREDALGLSSTSNSESHIIRLFSPPNGLPYALSLTCLFRSLTARTKRTMMYVGGETCNLCCAPQCACPRKHLGNELGFSQ